MDALNQNIAYEVTRRQFHNDTYCRLQHNLRKEITDCFFRVLFIICRILGTVAWTACLFAGGYIALFAIAVGIIFLLVTSLF